MRALVADDSLGTRRRVAHYLADWGYTVEEASDGDQAWDRLNRPDPPSLVVMDWMMPGMEGVEVCRRVAARKDGPFIYIILLTSKNKREDLIQALQSGAHDYQAKPVDPNELYSRVTVGQRLIEAHRQIRSYAENMESLAVERARQLIHADRLTSLGTLTAGLIHEIRNPLMYIMNVTELLESELDNFTVKTASTQPRIFTSHDLFTKTVGNIRECCDRINAIIKGVQLFGSDTPVDSERSSVDVNQVVDSAIRLCWSKLKHKYDVRKVLDDNLPVIQVNEQQIVQVLVNLIVNAADAMEQEGTLTITTRREADCVQLLIQDEGHGIAESQREAIFKPFFTTKALGKGTGLGLSISADIVHNHGGSIQVRNRSDRSGAVFDVRLPLEKGA